MNKHLATVATKNSLLSGRKGEQILSFVHFLPVLPWFPNCPVSNLSPSCFTSHLTSPRPPVHLFPIPSSALPDSPSCRPSWSVPAFFWCFLVSWPCVLWIVPAPFFTPFPPDRWRHPLPDLSPHLPTPPALPLSKGELFELVFSEPCIDNIYTETWYSERKIAQNH